MTQFIGDDSSSKLTMLFIDQPEYLLRSWEIPISKAQPRPPIKPMVMMFGRFTFKSIVSTPTMKFFQPFQSFQDFIR
jgi:hypothetical protein